jgi:hypothetical protein
MSTASDDATRISLTLRDGQLAESLTVRNAWLPLVIWEGVRVKLRGTRGLSLMERFVIKALLELQNCNAEDLREVAAIPPELSAWLFASLVQRNLATQYDDTHYQPHVAACHDALQSNRVPIERDEERSFFWFPLTDEYVALQDSAGAIRRFRGIEPVGKYPLPERWRREKRATLIRRAVEEKRVYGADIGDLIDVSDDAILNDEYPAYHCAAVLPESTTGDWRLTLFGNRKRKQAQDRGGLQEGHLGGEQAELPLTIPVLPHLIDLWKKPLSAAQPYVHRELIDQGMSKVSFGKCSCSAELGGTAATTMTRQRLLSPTLSLALQVDREIEYAIPLQLIPADSVAKRLFAIDEAVRELLTAPRPSDTFIAITQKDGITRACLIDRLWQLKLFAMVYQLREKEDFGL